MVTAVFQTPKRSEQIRSRLKYHQRDSTRDLNHVLLRVFKHFTPYEKMIDVLKGLGLGSCCFQSSHVSLRGIHVHPCMTDTITNARRRLVNMLYVLYRKD